MLTSGLSYLGNHVVGWGRDVDKIGSLETVMSLERWQPMMIVTDTPEEFGDAFPGIVLTPKMAMERFG